MKNFKTFLCWLIYKDILLQSHTEFDESFNVSLLEKDASFVLDETKIIRDGNSNYSSQYAEHYKKVIDFDKKPNFEKLKDVYLAIEVKFNSVGLERESLTFKQLTKIAKTFGTQDIAVSGDGHDWQMSEYTSGHDKEVVLTVSLDNISHLVCQYEDWFEKKEQIKEIKKIAKGLKI